MELIDQIKTVFHQSLENFSKLALEKMQSTKNIPYFKLKKDILYYLNMVIDDVITGKASIRLDEISLLIYTTQQTCDDITYVEFKKSNPKENIIAKL